MTSLRTPGPSALQLSAPGPGGQWLLVVIAKRTYTISRSGECILAPEQLPLRTAPLFHAERKTQLVADLDIFPWKELTDVVVRGHAYPGVKGSATTAEVAVRDTVKRLAVIGDRRTSTGPGGKIQFSSSEPFDCIPLEYDRAYGGWDERTELKYVDYLAPIAPYLQENSDPHAHSLFVYPRNRHGRGYIVKASAEGLDGMLLPNLEDPAERLTPEGIVVTNPLLWHRMPLPAGTTWVPFSYFGRGAFVGMFPFWQPLPEVLPEIERGYLPDAVRKVSVFNADPLILRSTNGASLGLQLPYLQPRERMRLLQLHPVHPKLELELPDDAPRIAVDGRNGKLSWTDPVIHSVEIEPDENRLSIVWRGAAAALRPYLPAELETMPMRVEWRDS